jgi:hypothetical protein
MLTYEQDLPFVDEHAIEIEGPRERVWEALQRTAPSTGFRVTESAAPAKLVLEGRHPFSRYALVFLIEELDSGRSRARAQTWAAFPGAAGRVYRALVIGSGMHAVLVRRMLRRLA